MSRDDPKPLGDPVKHYFLATSMAKAAGVDLVRATEEGALSQEDWAEAVHRCRDCDWERDGGCGRWLALQEAGTAEVPETCVNQDVFTGLLARP